MTKQESFKLTNERRKKLKARLRELARRLSAKQYWEAMEQVIHDQDEISNPS
jgi:hypothetical protein